MASASLQSADKTQHCAGGDLASAEANRRGPVTTSTYLLPDRPAQHEQFQWLAKEIRDNGGDATLVRAREIEGMSREKVVALFNSVRDADFTGLKKTLQPLLKTRKANADAAVVELERATRRFRELREIDFFESPRGHEVAMLLQRVKQNPKRAFPRLSRKAYRGKTWQTRPRPEIDRPALPGSSANRRPVASFVFSSKLPSQPDIIPFDMVEAEFSHHGDACTFETLTKRFGIEDKAVRKIGEMIHDADLDDAKFQRVEGIGIDRVLKGWGKTAMPDDEILSRGFLCFDGFYEFLQKR